MMNEKSLFDRIGGEVALMAAVDRFYDLVLADPLTAPFFERLDMDGQVKKQVAFMTRVMGGPNAYHGRGLREAHADLDLEDQHFDAVAGHLRTALEDLGVAEALIEESLAIVESARGEVLNHAETRG